MFDVLIIGSGPAGLSAAVYTKRANLKIAVIEKVYYGTGQIAESHKVDNYLGFSGINGYELGSKFREHAVELGVEFIDGEVTEITEGAAWSVQLKSGERLETKAIIYATGAAHRKLRVPGEEEWTGQGVSYCATCDGAFFRGKTVAVVGGGNTALYDALYLSDICEKVYVIHRREQLRGFAHVVERIKEKDNIDMILKANVAEIKGTDGVEAVLLEDGRQIAVDGVFVAVGMEPNTDMIKPLIELNDLGYVVADETGITNKDGFFVAGDVREKTLRQVITAVSDGANAALAAEMYCRR